VRGPRCSDSAQTLRSSDPSHSAADDHHETAELWAAFDSLKADTAASIRWVLAEQRNEGQRETYVPSGPGGDRGLYSTIIGAVAYFHPARLYYGAKLGGDIDLAFRLTLETIWSHFIQGGFRHNTSWQAYGPYLTLQLPHAFLLLGDLDRMDELLGWAIGNAAFARVSRYDGATEEWQVTTGTWNEQHAYTVSDDFTAMPFRVWYMGDMPHGWAAAEFMLLLREMLFFEAGEDDTRELYIAPGILPRWLSGDGGHSVTVTNAATTYGTAFGYTLVHDEPNRKVVIDITQPVTGVNYVYPCRLGAVNGALPTASRYPWRAPMSACPGHSSRRDQLRVARSDDDPPGATNRLLGAGGPRHGRIAA
jgi:hypothetical protein